MYRLSGAELKRFVVVFSVVLSISSAQTSIPGPSTERSNVYEFDLDREVRLQRSGQSQESGEYRAISQIVQNYEAASEDQRGKVLQGLDHEVRSLCRESIERQVTVIGSVIYYLARLPDRQTAIEMITKTEQLCPTTNALRFVYSPRVDGSPRVTTDLFGLLRRGLYLEAEPAPMDENPRLSVKEFEVPPWDAASLNNLRSRIISNKGTVTEVSLNISG